MTIKKLAETAPMDPHLVVYPSVISGQQAIVVDCIACGTNATYFLAAMSLRAFLQYFNGKGYGRRCRNMDCSSNHDWVIEE